MTYINTFLEKINPMAKHILVVCKACGAKAENDHSNSPADGICLLNKLKELHQQWPRQEELQIETTSCLCICERPCAIAYVGTHKPTYLFGDLDPINSGEDLIRAAELYLDSEDGMVPAYKLPEGLRPCRIARIPPAP
jgi:predicted metal-binding protein